jgi:plastocyanin
MKGNIGILAGALMVLMILTVPGCTSDSTNPYGTNQTPSNIPPNTVVMASLSFTPSSLTIAKGTTITWRNDDAIVHTSTSDTTGWDTGNVAAGASKTTVFNTSGTFKYHCTYHRAMGMVGTITVQ